MKINFKLVIPALILVLALLGVGGFMLYQNQSSQLNLDPEEGEFEKKLVAEVGRSVDLPKDETPIITTIIDVAALKDQPFFQKAKNGDKVLIYIQSKKAILYDPNLKKVIDLAPINIGTPSAGSLPKVALRNGTATVGLTNIIESKLKKANIAVNVASKENAEKQNYQKSVLVLLNDSAKDLAQAIERELNITVGELPTGEIKPSGVDIVVILGKDATK